MEPVTDKQKNRELNSQEYDAGRPLLRSTPQYVTIGAHYKCNAKCTFCLGGDFPDFSLDLYRSFFEPKLGSVLANADHVGFCGFGELLLMPGIEQFLDHVNRTLPDTPKVLNTNGIALAPRLHDRLTDGRYSILVSLHAADAALHREMTGTNRFDDILRNITQLQELGRKKNNPLHINLIFIATSRNIDNLPAFVKQAHDLGVDRISCNYLTIFEPEQVAMSCFFHQERTLAAFDEAEALARSFNINLGLPPRFGATAPEKPYICHDPWNFFYVEVQGSVNPCCFAGNHIGYLNQSEFDSIWNGPGYVKLREALVSGNTHAWCKHCYRFNPANVNDIRSHITFRPETQQKILRYLSEHRHEYPLPEKTLEL